MKLSIIILNYKTPHLTKYLLRSFAQFHFPWDFECIVIDNDTDTKLQQIMQREFQNFLYVRNKKNIGYARGVNQGVARAKGEYILCLNTDLVIQDTAITSLVAFLDTHAHVGVIGPKLYHPSDALQHSCLRYPTPLTPLYRRTFFGKLPVAKNDLAHYTMKDFDHETASKVDWLISSCILVRRSIWEELQGFDERFFVYFADTDFCKRVYEEASKEVWYLPEVSAVHYYRRESAERVGLTSLLDKTTRIHIHDWLQYLRKHGFRLHEKNHKSQAPSDK